MFKFLYNLGKDIQKLFQQQELMMITLADVQNVATQNQQAAANLEAAVVTVKTQVDTVIAQLKAIIASTPTLDQAALQTILESLNATAQSLSNINVTVTNTTPAPVS